MSDPNELPSLSEVLAPRLKRVSQPDRNAILAICDAQVELRARAKVQRNHSEVAEQLGPLQRRIAEQTLELNRAKRRVEEAKALTNYQRGRGDNWRDAFTHEAQLLIEMVELLTHAIRPSWRNLWGALRPRPPRTSEALLNRISDELVWGYATNVRMWDEDNSSQSAEVPA